jgi:hypothetical protein
MVYLSSTLVADMLVYMVKVLVDVLVTIAQMVSDEVSQHIPVVLGINFLLEENKAFETMVLLRTQIIIPNRTFPCVYQNQNVAPSSPRSNPKLETLTAH